MNILLPFAKSSLKSRPRWFWPAIAAGGLLGVGTISYAAVQYRKQTTQPFLTPVAQTTVAPTPSPTPTPTPPTYSHLNGAAVTAGQENVRPLAVMIENHPDARPQSGLDVASVVYEAVAEGGITRFMALYGDPAQAVRLGPIRSSRPYYIHFAAEYGASYAHIGGSADAMSLLASGRSGVQNIDGLSLGEPLFVRDFSRKVALEHTEYSTTDRLWAYAASQHWPATNEYPSLPFADDAPAVSRPAAQVISVSVSAPEYAVRWEYDPASNSYKRTMAGQPHIDVDDNKQITAKTVVLQTVNSSPYIETYGGGISKTVSDVTLTGSGAATVIENGTATKGTWKYDGARTRYYDAAGKELSLVRGKLWVELTYGDSVVSF